MVEEGLNLAISDLLPVEFDTKGKYRVKLTLLVCILIKLCNFNEIIILSLYLSIFHQPYYKLLIRYFI